MSRTNRSTSVQVCYCDECSWRETRDDALRCDLHQESGRVAAELYSALQPLPEQISCWCTMDVSALSSYIQGSLIHKPRSAHTLQAVCPISNPSRATLGHVTRLIAALRVGIVCISLFESLQSPWGDIVRCALALAILLFTVQLVEQLVYQNCAIWRRKWPKILHFGVLMAVELCFHSL